MPSAVKQVAADHGIAVCQPRSLRLDGKYPEEAQAARVVLQDLAPELMVVAAYGLILPQWVLDLPAHGCLNIHASLLPRWRGAAPIQRAIEAGDTASGVTIMQMDAGLDTGAMVRRVEYPIASDETGASLYEALAQLGGQAIVRVLEQLDTEGHLVSRPQPAAGVSYAAKLLKTEAPLDFSLPASVLERRIRAFDPFPGSTLMLPGIDDPVKVWAAQALPDEAGVPHHAPGTVAQVDAKGIDVSTVEGVLRILVLQRSGGKRQPVDVFVQGWNGV